MQFHWPMFIKVEIASGYSLLLGSMVVVDVLE